MPRPAAKRARADHPVVPNFAYYLARAALVDIHGAPGRPDTPHQRTVADAVVRTLLSQNTTDLTSARAFASLKEVCATPEAMRTADPARIEDAIRCGGLAEIKAERIQAMLNAVHEERGTCDMEYVRDLSTEDVKTELGRFKGVGPKTVSCVLLFCLERADFPVDTHVHRICTQRLKWAPKTATRDQTYDLLNARVPDDIKYDLHVLLVSHGKVCTACAMGRRPSRGAMEAKCPLGPVIRLGGGGPVPPDVSSLAEFQAAVKADATWHVDSQDASEGSDAQSSDETSTSEDEVLPDRKVRGPVPGTAKTEVKREAEAALGTTNRATGIKREVGLKSEEVEVKTEQAEVKTEGGSPPVGVTID